MVGIEDDKPTAAVQSVDRALQVLEIVAGLGQAGVTEIAAELGVHKSTASRLIAALESRGYLQQVSDRGKYRLGYTISRLARTGSAQLDLAKVSQDVCNELAADLGETTNLAILDGDRSVNIVEAFGPGEITLRTWVGQSCPAHATSSGKALLAGLDAAQLRPRLGSRLETFTPHTVGRLSDLAQELSVVRDRGWATVSEELEIGLNAVGAPVYDAEDRVVAALSVSGPSYRLREDLFEDVGKRTVAAAVAISRRLGWVDH